ncbi:hypothetical protein STEG23_014236 [Scotinomys teguina]
MAPLCVPSYQCGALEAWTDCLIGLVCISSFQVCSVQWTNDMEPCQHIWLTEWRERTDCRHLSFDLCRCATAYLLSPLIQNKQTGFQRKRYGSEVTVQFPQVPVVTTVLAVTVCLFHSVQLVAGSTFSPVHSAQHRLASEIGMHHKCHLYFFLSGGSKS